MVGSEEHSAYKTSGLNPTRSATGKHLLFAMIQPELDALGIEFDIGAQ